MFLCTPCLPPLVFEIPQGRSVCLFPSSCHSLLRLGAPWGHCWVSPLSLGVQEQGLGFPCCDFPFVPAGDPMKAKTLMSPCCPGTIDSDKTCAVFSISKVVIGCVNKWSYPKGCLSPSPQPHQFIGWIVCGFCVGPQNWTPLVEVGDCGKELQSPPWWPECQVLS